MLQSQELPSLYTESKSWHLRVELNGVKFPWRSWWLKSWHRPLVAGSSFRHISKYVRTPPGYTNYLKLFTHYLSKLAVYRPSMYCKCLGTFYPLTSLCIWVTKFQHHHNVSADCLFRKNVMSGDTASIRSLLYSLFIILLGPAQSSQPCPHSPPSTASRTAPSLQKSSQPPEQVLSLMVIYQPEYFTSSRKGFSLKDVH
jgi:hypothetical protein